MLYRMALKDLSKFNSLNSRNAQFVDFRRKLHFLASHDFESIDTDRRVSTSWSKVTMDNRSGSRRNWVKLRRLWFCGRDEQCGVFYITPHVPRFSSTTFFIYSFIVYHVHHLPRSSSTTFVTTSTTRTEQYYDWCETAMAATQQTSVGNEGLPTE